MRLVVAVTVAIAALSACWRGGSSAPPPPVVPEEPVHGTVSMRPTASGCTRVGENVDELLQRSEDQSLVSRAEAIREVVERRCESDGWSDELRQCLVSADSIHDTDDCERLATPEQRSALDEDLTTIEDGH